MASTPTDNNDTRPAGRLPRPALIVAGIGLLLSLAIFGLGLTIGGSATEVEWDVVEPLDPPAATTMGDNGTLGMGRTSIAAMAPNDEGTLIFRLAGVVMVSSGGPSPTTVRCDVNTTNGGEETMVARTTSKRAVWPRPSTELQRQEVPELAVAKFNTHGANVAQLPIRDVFRRYTDGDTPTLLDWEGYEDRSQAWLWTLPEGTGTTTVTLGFAALFRTDERPKGNIVCRGNSGRGRTPDQAAELRIPVELETWPVPDERNREAESQATDIK